ncbi:hypothetical protein [Arthrobacter sp. Soil736]|uniref:hypothetical protein n=1 Tax=Arthrobacter sp. Soil736 TaxID=1736395 RepID=UPI0009E7EB1C|nr:hypothetical protein [Arthrobacter sp. Soil736]
MRPDKPKDFPIDIQAFDIDLPLVPWQVEEIGEIKAVVRTCPVAGLKREPFETGCLVVCNPEVVTMANDRADNPSRRSPSASRVLC